MTIECEYCNDEVWCLRHEGEWVCKHCFIEEGLGDYQDWNQLNDEAKMERQRKRIQEFDDEHINI